MKKSKLKYLLFVGILLISIYFGSPLNVMAVTRKSNPSPSCPSGTYSASSTTCIKEKKTYTYKCPDTSYSQPGGNKSPTCIKNGKSVKGTKITHTTKTTVPKDQCPAGFYFDDDNKCKSGISFQNGLEPPAKINFGETKKVKIKVTVANKVKNKNININKIVVYDSNDCYTEYVKPVVKNNKFYLKVKVRSKPVCDYEEPDYEFSLSFHFGFIKLGYKEGNYLYPLDYANISFVEKSNTSTTSNQSKSSSSSSTKKSTSSTKKSKKITIKCNDSSFSVDKGKKKTIGYTVTGATSSQKKNVSFKSMDTKIATVGARKLGQLRLK